MPPGTRSLRGVVCARLVMFSTASLANFRGVRGCWTSGAAGAMSERSSRPSGAAGRWDARSPQGTTRSLATAYSMAEACRSDRLRSMRPCSPSSFTTQAIRSPCCERVRGLREDLFSCSRIRLAPRPTGSGEPSIAAISARATGSRGAGAYVRMPNGGRSSGVLGSGSRARRRSDAMHERFPPVARTLYVLERICERHTPR